MIIDYILSNIVIQLFFQGFWRGPCSGPCSNSRFICDKLFPHPVGANQLRIPTNKWLNSGGFIGFSTDVHRIIDDIANIPLDMLMRWPGADQGLYTHMFLAGKWNIELDYNNHIFQSWGLVDDPAEPRDPSLNSRTLMKRVLIDNDFLWQNHFTKSIPAVLHFNADGKSSGMFKKIARSINANQSHGDTKCAKMHKIWSKEI